MGLKREIRIYIESELRDYDNTKKEWELLQNEIIDGKTNKHDDYMERLGLESPEICNGPTESTVLKLISNKRLSQLERTIRAFERVMTNLPEDKFRLVQMRYWDIPRTLTDDGISLELNIDKATLYRWINGILLALASEMGLVDEIHCD